MMDKQIFVIYTHYSLANRHGEEVSSVDADKDDKKSAKCTGCYEVSFEVSVEAVVVKTYAGGCKQLE